MKVLAVVGEVLLEMIRGIAGVIITLAIFVGVIAGVAMGLFGTSSEQVLTPDVQGKTVQEAEAMLAERGLSLDIVGREHDEKTPADQIVRTNPYEGKRVKRGRSVQCVVSLGSRSVTVPKVTGLMVPVAEERLRAAGLSVEDIRRQRSDQPRDRVLKQIPPAGGKVGRSGGVVIMASGGSNFGRMRAVDGKTWLFKRVRLTVPRGSPLQRVQVIVKRSDEEDTVYDRVHRPGDDVRVNVTGHAGWNVQVRLSGKKIFSETF